MTDGTALVEHASKKATNSSRFHFISLLGEGSFGTVLKAWDNNGKSYVAIKLFKAPGGGYSILQFIASRSAQRRQVEEARKEAYTLHQLRHPNIVGYITSYEYSISIGKKGFAIVTRFCEKGSLERYLTKERPPEMKRRKWLKQLTTALKFIHSQSIAHRDLKPGNILIDGEDDLKICDVGLAKCAWDIQKIYLRQSEGGDTKLEKYMTTTAGTMYFMAPEVWNNHYNYKSDIFSLGLVFILIAEGKTCPTAIWQNSSYCLGELLYEKIPPRSSPASHLINPQLQYSKPSEVRLFNKMLKYDYHERPNAEEVAEDLTLIEKESEKSDLHISPSENLDPSPEPTKCHC